MHRVPEISLFTVDSLHYPMVDLFATIASIAGVFDLPNIDDLNDLYPGVTFDSIDLTPLLLDPTTTVRDWIYSEDWDAKHGSIALRAELKILLGY